MSSHNSIDDRDNVESEHQIKKKKQKNKTSKGRLGKQQKKNSSLNSNDNESNQNEQENNTMNQNLLFKEDDHASDSAQKEKLEFEEQKGIDGDLQKNKIPLLTYNGISDNLQDLNNEGSQESNISFEENSHDNEHENEDIEIDIISYENSSQSVMNEEQQYDEIEEEDYFEQYMKSNCQQFGLSEDISSENETKSLNESGEEDIFSDYAEIGKGYIKFNLPKLLKEIQEMENNKIQQEILNQQIQNQQPQNQNNAFNKTRNKSSQQTTEMKQQQEIQIKDRQQRISFFHQHLQQKKQTNTRLGGNKATLNNTKTNYANTNNQIGSDYKHQYISSRKKRENDTELESLGLQSQSKRRPNKTSGQYEESETQQKEEEFQENSQEAEENTKTKKQKQIKPKNNVRSNRNSDNYNQKSETVKPQISSIATAQSKKKVEQNTNDGDDDLSDIPITLPKDQQMELLKYHKRSKNYHGTAKQFGITHEEARVIVKKLKKEYKSIQNY